MSGLTEAAESMPLGEANQQEYLVGEAGGMVWETSQRARFGVPLP